MIKHDLQTDAREALVHRIVEWRGLRRAEKLRQVMFCLAESIDGPMLTEKELAARLFPRPPGHGTADDSIVRVSVRQLRFKLQEYFSSEGTHEPWIIEIPKGEYVLRFSERKVEPLVAISEKLPPSHSNLPWTWALVFSCLACTLLGYGIARAIHADPAPPRNLLTKVMDGGRFSLTIVPGDASLRTLTMLWGGEPNLAEYLSGNVPDPPDLKQNEHLREAYRWMLATKTVTAPHAAVTASIVGSLGELRSRATVRHPRDLTVRALQVNSFVFLASRLMDPVVDLFESQFTLRCDNDAPRRQIGIVDTLANHGRGQRYTSDTTQDISYARVALLPNLGQDGGRVLILSGLGSVGTESAARLACDPRWLSELESRLPRGQLYFEALIEAKAINAMPVELHLRIVRPIAARR